MTACLEEEAGATSPAEIIPSVSLEALLARRDAAVAALTTIAGGMADFHAVGDAIWPPDDEVGRGGSAPYKFCEPLEQRPSGHGAYLTDEKWLEQSIACIDAALWRHLLDKSGLRSFLDQKARTDWDEQIEKNGTPPLTPDNIRATFASLHSRRGEFFERGVIAVFRSLSWDYKTNRPCKFGKRIIVRYIVDAYGHPNRGDGLDDLERAFHVLDGKPEPDHRNGVTSRLWARNKQVDKHADLVDDYLRIRTFKNGNGHVTFLRPDLVDEFNRILARHYPDALPAPVEDARAS